ncbi:MAG: ROK family protein [Actinomycetota bacterium]
MDLALAIDVGATKVAVAVVDDAGRVRDRATMQTARPVIEADGPVPAETGDQLFARLAALLDDYRPFDRFACCGIGSAGPMTGGGEAISPLNIPAFRSYPLAERVRALTGLPCRLDNDAKALALAEGWIGGAVGVSDYLAMVVSTGVGGGIVLQGRLLDGGSGNAGHIGQTIVRAPGRAIPSHVAGSLEAEASGRAIAAHTGHPATEATTAVVAQTGVMVGQAAGSVANLLDLRLVLVAGSVALGFGEPFFAAAQAEMDRVCRLAFTLGARIEPAGCGDDGPLVGAAAVGFRGLGRPVGSVIAG